MKSEEKKRRLHEALLRMLYPPSPPQEDSYVSADASSGALNCDQFPEKANERFCSIIDECNGWIGSLSSSGADEDESESEDQGDCDGPKKLTRAQRKRIRKKKLKETASKRRKIIGPTFPDEEEDCLGEANADVAKEEPGGVGQYASDVPHTGANNPESMEAPSCSKRNKQKHRRMVKKLASEKLRSPSTGNHCLEFCKEGD